MLAFGAQITDVASGEGRVTESLIKQMIATPGEIGRQSANIELSVQGSPRRLSNRYELLVIRIVQKPLHNVERHASATRVRVDLSFGPDQLIVEVIDNGLGTVPSGQSGQHPAEYGLGLRGMEERTKLLQGSLVIESERGRGTEVSLLVPLIREDHDLTVIGGSRHL